MISILILTKNEEVNLAGCIEAVRWSDDIHVLDSYSTDSTAEIARELGVKVWLRKFDSYSAQQNWALGNITFKRMFSGIGVISQNAKGKDIALKTVRMVLRPLFWREIFGRAHGRLFLVRNEWW